MICLVRLLVHLETKIQEGQSKNNIFQTNFFYAGNACRNAGYSLTKSIWILFYLEIKIHVESWTW